MFSTTARTENKQLIHSIMGFETVRFN